jgi:PAS domain S-box-containing protein
VSTAGLPQAAPYSALARTVMAVAAAFVVLVWGAWGAFTYLYDEPRAVEGAYRQTDAMARAIGENVDTIFQGADAYMRFLRTPAGQAAARDGEALAEAAGVVSLAVTDVAIVDRDGRVLLSNARRTDAERPFADAPILRAALLANGDKMLVGAPAKSPLTGQWTIPVARPVFTNGRIDGVVILGIDPYHFQRFYRSLDDASGMTATIFRSDGQVLSYSSLTDDMLASPWRLAQASSLFETTAPVTTRRAKTFSVLDGSEKILTMQIMSRYGVAVSAALSADDVMRPVVQRRVGFAGFAALVTLGVMLATLRVRNATRTAEQLTQKLECERRRVQQISDRLEDVIETMPASVVLIDAQGRFVLTNNHYRSMFPGAEDLIVPGKTIQTFAEELYARGILDARVDTTRRAWWSTPPEQRNVHTSEQRWPTGWVHLVDAPSREGGLIGIRVDVTERKLREQELQTARERLAAQADELRSTIAELTEAKRKLQSAYDARGLFLANVSHELRTPLNAIIGFADLLTHDEDNSPEVKREYARMILESGRYQLALVEDLLDTAQAEANRLEIQPRLGDLAAVVRSAVESMRLQAESAGLTLTCSVPDDASCVFDARRLRQIVLNLVANAIKYTRPGGRVDVALEGDTDQAWAFTVADNGIGISAEDLPRVMEPFTQLANERNRAGGGTGLGLPLSRKLAELHGGSLQIESEPGRGTRVTVRLPTLHLDSPPQSAAAE